jgi:regulatory protein
MSESDGRLAKVSYLPGARRASESDSAHADTGAPASSTTSPSRIVSDQNDGWYVEPDPVDAAASDTGRPPLRSTGIRESGGPVFLPTSGPVVPNDTETDDAPTGTNAAVPSRPESPAMIRMRAMVEAASSASAREVDEPAPESDDELAARAENISMSALIRKGMSVWEMADRLRSRDLDETTVQNEVARLERVGLLNDVELAENLVRTLQDRKGLGRSGITAELRRRHVDPDAIEEALDALDGDDEIARASEIAIKRAPQLRSLDNVTAKRRLSAFLMRKGYSGSVISAAVAAALEPSGPRFR